MKINLSFATLAMTGSGEIERPVEKSADKLAGPAHASLSE